MGQCRERSTLKEAILNATREMFLSGGIKNISIRAIASRVNHSVGTIYLYYQNKSALLHALRQDGLLRLSEAFISVSPSPDAHDSLKEACRAYIDFAMRNPQTYNLVFSPLITPKSEDAEAIHPAIFIVDSFQEKIVMCSQQGYSQFDNDRTATIITVSLLHGFASLFSTSCLSEKSPVTEAGDLHKSLEGFLDTIIKKFN